MMNMSIHFVLHLFIGSSITQRIFTVVSRVLYQKFGALVFLSVLAQLSLSLFNVYLESLLLVMIKLAGKMYCLSCLSSEKSWYSVVIADIGHGLGNFIGTGIIYLKGTSLLKIAHSMYPDT